MKTWTLAMLTLTGLLAGCGDRHKDILQLQSFLQQHPQPLCSREYRLLPPDVILIRSRHVAEINEIEQQIRPDGKINLPLLGEVTVLGLTPKQVEQELEKLAKDYYQEVDATVQVVAYNSQRYYVFGQVLRPGPYAYTGQNTVLEAIGLAQPNFHAWPERIRLVRGRSPQTGGYILEAPQKQRQQQFEREGKTKVGADAVTINLMAMITQGDLSHNVLLQPDDVVYVPADPLSEIGFALQKLLFPTRPVLEATRVPATLDAAGTP